MPSDTCVGENFTEWGFVKHLANGGHPQSTHMGTMLRNNGINIQSLY